jgi:hypothetical protein
MGLVTKKKAKFGYQQENPQISRNRHTLDSQEDPAGQYIIYKN